MEYYKSYYVTRFPMWRYVLRPSRTRGPLFTVIGNGTGGVDPFDVLAESRTQNTRPPYEEFAALDINDHNGLLDYANRRTLPNAPSVEYNSKVSPAPPARRDRLGRLTTSLSARDSGQPEPYPLPRFQRDVLRFRAVLTLKALVERPDDAALGAGAKDLLKAAGLRYKTPWFRAPGEFPSSDPRLARFDYAGMFATLVRRALAGSQPEAILRQRDSGEWEFGRQWLVRDFLQALYATLFEDVTASTRLCADPKCGRPFREDHRRPGATAYCSTSHATRTERRKTYHRERNAVALHQQGIPLSRVAKTVGSDLETVKGWIAKGGKHGTQSRERSRTR